MAIMGHNTMILFVGWVSEGRATETARAATSIVRAARETQQSEYRTSPVVGLRHKRLTQPAGCPVIAVGGYALRANRPYAPSGTYAPSFSAPRHTHGEKRLIPPPLPVASSAPSARPASVALLPVRQMPPVVLPADAGRNPAVARHR